MKFCACGSVQVERYILCQKPGYAVAYRLKRAFTGQNTQFLNCRSVRRVRLEKLRYKGAPDFNLYSYRK